MHNETDLESQDESVDSDTDNHTELECYDDTDNNIVAHLFYIIIY